jgi:predicted ATPase
MLKELEIHNFRCFEHLRVELKPLNVLIGENNSGKSSFLDAIKKLGRLTNIVTDRYRLDSKTSGIKAYMDNGTLVDWTIDWKIGSPALQGQVPGIEFFRLPSNGAACRSQGFPDSSASMPLNEDGSNMASVLDYMLRKDRKRFLGVVSALEKLLPGFEDLLIQTPDANSRHIHLKLDNGLELPGEALSSGVRHLLFFTTLAYHPRAPKIILIEEPEIGVHPQRLKQIVELLRGITRGEHCDQPAQVILTTHSTYLLDHINPDTDQVLTFHREKGVDGKRLVKPIDRERLSKFLDEFLLGEVWYNESEDGLVVAEVTGELGRIL